MRAHPGFIATQRRRVVVVALGAGLLLALLISMFPDRTARRWRDVATDLLLLHLPTNPVPAGRSPGVVVVDIDRESLRAVGPWPWPRDRLADLVGAIARSQPRLVALDMLIAGPDRSSPAALAERLAGASGDTELARRIAALPTTDERLAAAITAIPTVVGFLLADEASGEAPATAPILVSGTTRQLTPWHAVGAQFPAPALADVSAGLGAASLDPGLDGVVRSVALLVGVGDDLFAGLAAEALRVAVDAGALLVPGDGTVLRIGEYAVPLPQDATLRIRPSDPQHWETRTISASALLAGTADPSRLKGKIVLIGGGAPDLGGLWRTAASVAAPSVQIQADALDTLLSGRIPRRPDWAWLVEITAGIALAGIAAVAAVELAPLAGLALYLAFAALYMAGAAAALAARDLLIDPLTPPLAGLVVAAVAGTMAFSETRRAATAMRRRFERHLDPTVVARITERPDLIRLAGERRKITALFTDIEGFTTTADRLEPEVLVALLDRYFEGITRIMVEHGGMVDKIVGDAVHALFNAPLDLPDHATRAVRCALAIAAHSRAFRLEPENAVLGLGRTRIGVETGEAVVGEVGAALKLDYTAYGTAMNTAARLEALNKELGTTICVGPVCRAATQGIDYHPLGSVEVRGLGPLDVFEPIEDETGVSPAHSPAPR